MFAQAEPLYLEAIQRLKESLGEDSPAVAGAIHNLAGLYFSQKKMKESKEYYQEALRRKSRVLGSSHPDTATTLFHLAEVLRMEGQTADAISLLSQSVSALEDSGAGTSPAACRRLSRLSELLLAEVWKVELALPASVMF